jgi:hypothetical protein
MTGTGPHQVSFSPNPVQKAFIESRAKADLYSSRMGEGKSTALCWAELAYTRHNPGATGVIVRDTWENLRGTTQKTFFEWFPPGIFGTYKITEKTFTWAEGVASGNVMFLGMDDPVDAGKIMSREFGFMAMDEPAPAVGSAGIDEMIFDIGLSRLRQQGMKWYAMKLAENNPDENHWTYRRFVSPGTEGFKLWQPTKPENEANLPSSYYQELRRVWAHRPDLVRRFVDGEFGFQTDGKPVTPQWDDKRHLALGLVPVQGVDLHLLWDFGHNPTCIVTQKTPLGSWLVLEALVGEEIGVAELIGDAVKPLLADRYRKFALRHIGDPAGNQREQTSIYRSAVRLLKRELGGTWRSGPVRLGERVEPLRAVLNRNTGGYAVVRVDRHRAAAVWQALRGGWHFNVSRTGLVSGEPVKNISSHPGDAMGYGAAVLFPLGRLTKTPGGLIVPQQAVWGSQGQAAGVMGFERPGPEPGAGG